MKGNRISEKYSFLSPFKGLTFLWQQEMYMKPQIPAIPIIEYSWHVLTDIQNYYSYGVGIIQSSKNVLKRTVFLWLSYRLHFWTSGLLLLNPIWKIYVNANQSPVSRILPIWLVCFSWIIRAEMKIKPI